MQIFFLNRLWRLLKNGHLPVKLYLSAPPPPARVQIVGFSRFSFCRHLFIFPEEYRMKKEHVLIPFVFSKLRTPGVGGLLLARLSRLAGLAS